MKKSWTMTKLIATGGFSALTAVGMLTGAGLAAASGTFAASAPVGLIVQSTMYSLNLLVVRQLGAGTLMGLVFGLLVVPLPTVGTSGFFPKVIITGLMGLGADLIFLTIKNEKLAALIAGGVTQLIIGLVLFGAAKAFGFPGINNLPAFLSKPTGLIISYILVFLVGAFGGFIAWTTYRKIKNTTVVKRIQL